MEFLVTLFAQFLAVTIVITIHEFAHAYSAYKCGDPTAKMMGRMTLNPIKHFDLLGILMFALAGFGWAKPVPINPNNFKHYKKGAFWTAIAGVLANYISAFLFYGLFLLVKLNVYPLVVGKYAEYFVYHFFNGLFVFSLSFCVFNLLPIYPLDGFRVIESSNMRRGKLYWFLRQNGQYLLFLLIGIHYLANSVPVLGYFDLLGYALTFAKDIFGKPITLFWSWIFGIL